MCYPILIAAGVAAAGIAIEAANRSEQQAALEKSYRRNAEQANEQAKESFFQTSIRQATEAEVSAHRIQDIEIQGAELQAVVAVRAAEGGVGGASVAAALQEVEFDQGRAIAREIRTRKLLELQGQLDKRSTRLATQASILAGQPSGVQGVDIVGNISTGLSIGQSSRSFFNVADENPALPQNTVNP